MGTFRARVRGMAALIVIGVIVLAAIFWKVYDVQRLKAMEPAERQTFLAARSKRQADARQARSEKKQTKEASRLANGTATNRKISEVGKREDGTLGCPRCGSSQFKARKSTGKRTAIATTAVISGGITAVAGLAAKKNQVQCVACGARYSRG